MNQNKGTAKILNTNKKHSCNTMVIKLKNVFTFALIKYEIEFP